MLRPGSTVTRLTKKTGQKAEVGKILSVAGNSYEIQWDDGHTSFLTHESVVPAKGVKKK